MADKGRRAADRRRERMGDDALEAPSGEKTDLHSLDGEWVGPESGLLGGVAQLMEEQAGESLDPALTTGELPLFAESERVAPAPPEETVVAAQPRTRSPGGARVLVIDGPDKGVGQDLIFNEIVIGRSERADLVLRDDGISREHCTLRYVAGGFEVVDLGSESGTFLNGREVSQATLKPGDEIEIGETVLRFLRSDAAPPGERPPEVEEGADATAISVLTEEPAVRSPNAVVLTVVLVILVGAIATLAVSYYLYSVGKVRVGIDPGLSALLEEAKADFAAGRHEEAQVALKAFLEVRPHDEQAQVLLSRIEARKARAQLLVEVGRAAARGEITRAEELLAQLPEKTEERRKARELVERVREELRTASLDSVRRLIDENRPDAAEKVLEQHGQEFPGDEEAQALQAEISAVREALQEADADQRRSETNSALRPAVLAFSRGDVKGARQKLTRIYGHPQHGPAARRMTRDIDLFMETLGRGERLHRTKDVAGLTALGEAAKLDRALSSGGSPYTRRIGVMRADLLYLRGVGQVTRGDGCAARKSFESAVQLNATDEKSRQQLSRLSDQAKTSLAKARGLARTDPAEARRSLKRARCLVPAKSAVGREIRELQKELP